MKTPSHSIAAARARRQGGAVAVIFGLTVVVLVGFIGLAIDLGRFFAIKAELQNAMDACALSAASQLKPGASDPNALARAIAYGNVFSGGSPSDTSVKNRVNFQGMELDTAVIQISFSETNGVDFETPPPSGPALTDLSNRAQYVKCAYPLDGLPIYFMRVLNLLPTASIPATQTVFAMAVATRGASTAPCIPVAVCKSPGSTAGNSFGHFVGEWLSAVHTSFGTGNFGWIDFTPPAGGSDELKEHLKGSLQCDVSKIGDEVGAQGYQADLDEPWNSRFGWYKNLTPGEAAPDFTGYAYSNEAGDWAPNWPEGQNAYDGASSTGVMNFVDARAANAPVQTSSSGPIGQLAQPPGLPTNTYSPITAAEHSSLGRTDRRIVSAPVVDCSVWATGTNPGNAQPAIEGWACVLMLNPIRSQGPPNAPYRTAKLEFRGLATDALSACSVGAGGATTPVLTQ